MHANATLLLSLAKELKFTTQTCVNAFVYLDSVLQTNSGALKTASVYANLKFAQQACTGESMSMKLEIAVVSASLTNVKTATIGTKKLADALVHLWIVQ